MYDANKIIPGLIVFLFLASTPLWYNGITGKAGQVPEIDTTAKEKQCVEPTEYMSGNHMKLLVEWRTLVVRDGVTTYVSTSGKEYKISLVNTCLDCHKSKSDFCDRCHDYAATQIDCWACHQAPKEAP